MCQSLFCHKVAGLRPATLLKKRLWHRCFPVNFQKISKDTFFTEHLWMTVSVACKLKNILKKSGAKMEHWERVYHSK